MEKKENHIFKKVRTGSQAGMLADVLSASRDNAQPGTSLATVKDLDSRRMGLKLSCTSCDYAESLSGQALLKRFGADTPIKSVRPECPNCAKKSVNVIPG